MSCTGTKNNIQPIFNLIKQLYKHSNTDVTTQNYTQIYFHKHSDYNYIKMYIKKKEKLLFQQMPKSTDRQVEIL